MKFNKLFCVIAALAMGSLAFAGPHNFDTFTSNDSNSGNGNHGASLYYERSVSTAGALLVGNVLVHTGSSFAQNSNISFTTPGFDPKTCDALGQNPGTSHNTCSQDLVYSTNPLTTAFEILTNEFQDNQTDAGSGTLNETATAVLTSGASTYFSGVDNLGDGYSSFSPSNFYELDITIHIDPDNGDSCLGCDDGNISNGDPLDPGVDGVWRLAFGISSTNSATVGTPTLVQGGTDGNQFALQFSAPVAGGGEGTPAVKLTFVDSEFDPSGGAVPEPTTLLLLGSGLIAVARKFRS